MAEQGQRDSNHFKITLSNNRENVVKKQRSPRPKILANKNFNT